MKLFLQAVTKVTLGLLFLSVLVFLPAGTLAVFLFYPALICRRIREEGLLCEQLPGYRDYMDRVRYRLIPFVY